MTHVPQPGASQPGEASIIPSPKWAVCLWGGRHQPAKPATVGSRVEGAQGFEKWGATCQTPLMVKAGRAQA